MDGAEITTRLRATQVMALGQVRVVDLPLPAPGPGAIRVVIEGCGVCASNLGPWSGPPWMDFPLAPGSLGHEAWGWVDAVGRGVSSLHPGDRVAFLGASGFASHEVVPADAALPLPAALDGRPVPAEPVACAMMIFARARIAPGDTVALFGAGFLGAILTRLATEAGARVVAVSRRAESRALAGRMGATDAIAMEDHGTVLARLAALAPGGCDVALECAGHQWPLDLAAESLREGGRLVIAGYHQDGPRQVNMQLWNWRALEIVNAHERDQGAMLKAMRAAIGALAEGRIDLAPLLTHRYRLEDLAQALDDTRDKPAGFVKALVIP